MKHFSWAVIALVITSCHKNNDKVMPVADLQVQNVELPQRESSLITDTTVIATNSSIILNSGSPDWSSKIIKTATVNLELKNYHSFNSAVHSSMKMYGAYIAQEQQLESEGQINNTVTIKVPVDRFEDLVNYLTSDQKNKVLEKQISSEDVTAEYADTKARAETKRQVRAKYYELLKQARKMDDILQVQGEINNITEDIEAATGRVEYLSHQSAYSTINLKYYQILNAAKIDDSQPGFFTSLGNAFKSGASWIGKLIIGLVNIWPLLFIGAVAWYFIRKNISVKKPVIAAQSSERTSE